MKRSPVRQKRRALIGLSLQYLGFGVGERNGGRRAASQADVAHQTSGTDVESDLQEKDALLAKVEARDLIEFGMIPVSGGPGSLTGFRGSAANREVLTSRPMRSGVN